MISKISNFWYQNVKLVILKIKSVISQNHDDIIKVCWIADVYISKWSFSMSQIWFYDIINLMLWFHEIKKKIEISQNRIIPQRFCDGSKSNLWYSKIIMIFITKYIFDITSVVWNNVYLVISKIHCFVMINKVSMWYYTKKNNILWYHKTDFWHHNIQYHYHFDSLIPKNNFVISQIQLVLSENIFHMK